MIVQENLYNTTNISTFRSKMSDYTQLLKVRLTFTVVFSAAVGYLLATGTSFPFQLTSFIALITGGFMVVGSANGINQIIEKNYDKLMLRTNNRPIATNRMAVGEAAIFCLVFGVAGVYILGHFLNQLSALLGLIALLSYSFIYTPLKRVSPIAVLVGAFPGAIPPMLGWVAVTGSLGAEAWILFGIQFFWQFPHFWAIAWVLHEDYLRAGYQLLPSQGGRNRKSAFQTILYTIVLIPVSILPYFIGISGIISAVITIIAGLIFLWLSIKLYKSCEIKAAKKLMFFSFLYLPLVLLAFLFDKL